MVVMLLLQHPATFSYLFISFHISCVWHRFVSRCCVGISPVVWFCVSLIFSYPLRFHVWFAHQETGWVGGSGAGSHLCAFHFALKSYRIREFIVSSFAFENPLALWISFNHFHPIKISIFSKFVSTSYVKLFVSHFVSFCLTIKRHTRNHAGYPKSFTGQTPCGPWCPSLFQKGRVRRVRKFGGDDAVWPGMWHQD